MPSKSKTDRAMKELAKIRKEERKLAAREKKAVAVIKRERDKYQRELDQCRSTATKQRKKKAAKKKAAKKKTGKKKAAKKKAAKKKRKRAPSTMQIATTAEQIASAAYDLGGKRVSTRVQLADLRERLSHIDRTALDRALLKGQDAGRWVLYRNDNPRSVTKRDQAAALHVGGHPRHLIYLDRAALTELT